MGTTAKRLYVGGLTKEVNEEELKERFQNFGDIDEVDIRYKRDLGGMHLYISHENIMKYTIE